MRTAIAILTMPALATGPLYGDATEQPPPTPAQEQPEVMTRGPVHEALAEPVNLQVQAGLVVPDEPPANVGKQEVGSPPRPVRFRPARRGDAVFRPAKVVVNDQSHSPGARHAR